MTQKEMKAAMLRGLGRCIMAVQQEPEKHRDAVLWACTRNIAYDAQSEGTRAWYVYAMVRCFPDKEPFLRAAEETLEKYRPNGGWDLLHLSQLLMCFASEGFDSAWLALERKYQELLDGLFARKRRPNGIFYALSDLEQLGLVLAADSKSFLRIAEDFGRLYREKAYMEDGDFGWFFSEKGGKYRKTLERAAQKNEHIACFLQREQSNLAAREARWRQQDTLPAEALTGIRLSRWLVSADPATVERYALAYREETRPQSRTEALKAFAWCPYPSDPLPVIEDTQSPCEELRQAAWNALEQVRHPAVRFFALENASNGIHTEENFALLVTNYVAEDGPLLEKLLRARIADKDWDGVHAAGLDIGRAFCKGSGIPHPKHLLPLLYEHNPCSYCREWVVTQMARHRMLTRELLEECLYDSNEDIRSYAAKKWNV